MRFSTIIASVTLLAVGAAAAPSSFFVSHFANWRRTHELTPAQSSLITWAENVAATADIGAIEYLQPAFVDAFGQDDATFLLTGKDFTGRDATPEALTNLSTRAPSCECSSNNEWCPNTFGCRKGASK